jgi:hypothetical protein
VAAVQYTFTNKQYTEYRERNICNNKNKTKIGKCGPCPIFANYTLAFALQLRKKHGKTSVRIVFPPGTANSWWIKAHSRFTKMRTLLAEPKPWDKQSPQQLLYAVTLQSNAQAWTWPKTPSFTPI